MWEEGVSCHCALGVPNKFSNCWVDMLLFIITCIHRINYFIIHQLLLTTWSFKQLWNMLPTLELFTCVGFSYGAGMIKGWAERDKVCVLMISFLAGLLRIERVWLKVTIGYGDEGGVCWMNDCTSPTTLKREWVERF